MLLGNLNSIYGGTAHKEGNRASRGPVGTNCWCTICKRELFVYFVEISCFHPYRMDSETGEPEGEVGGLFRGRKTAIYNLRSMLLVILLVTRQLVPTEPLLALLPSLWAVPP